MFIPWRPLCNIGKMKIDAKLIVCAMSSNGFTLGDPDDPGMLDMAGFNSAALLVINSFVTNVKSFTLL